MTLEHVTVVNGKAVPVIRENKNNSVIVTHNGRTKTIFMKRGKAVENNVLTGKFIAVKIRRA